MGWLAPRIGVVTLYRLGLLLTGVILVVYGLLVYVENHTAFLASSMTLRAVEGVGTAAVLTGVRSIIINQFPQRMNSAMSLVEGMYGAGSCLGPALGGAMYSIGGYGAPFYALGTLSVANAAISLLLMPAVTEHQADSPENYVQGPNYRDSLLFALSNADSWLILAASCSVAVNWNGIDNSLAPYALDTLNMKLPELSLFFMGSFAGFGLSSPLWGRLSDSIDNTFVLEAVCLALVALGILLIPPSPLLGLLPSRLLLGVGMTLREVFQMGVNLPLLPLLVRLLVSRGMPDDIRSHALLTSLCGFTFAAGNALGPMFGGLVTDFWGFPVLATWLSGITALLSVMMAARALVYHLSRRTAPAHCKA
ncbi:MFS-type transporter SLC18B1 [Amphibalanus amphitrite]|uniref:MFS-type transporter SLC18B1 n=1 Tax=Amphibalanus amphitrite TaxID=1232801 RepID=A0A6A4WTQ9_AMPAM|nr:MFS-type transporter SLC18B1 [Amphibalanus amphitrite]